MAENYSIAIELNNYDKFIQNAEAVDKTIAQVGKSLEGLAKKFNTIDLGTIQLDTKSLEKLATLDLKGKSASLAGLARQYGALGEAVKTVDAQQLAEVNKSLSGGATAKTIETKSTALGLLTTELKKLEKLSLGIVPSQIRLILEALKSTGDIDVTKLNAANPAILTLVKALSKLDNIKVSEDSIRQLNLLSVALNNLGNDKTVSLLGAIAPKVKELAESFKSFAKGNKNTEIEVLPKVLMAAADALGKFVAISKQFGGGLFSGSAADNMSKVATAVREMGKAFIEFKSPTVGFENVEKNIAATIAALAKLKDAFSAFSGTSSANVMAASKAFQALGEAVTSLGRRTASFESLPANIEKMNQALRTLDVTRLEQIAPTLAKVAPALKAMADLATVSKNALGGLSTTVTTTSSSFSTAFGTIKSVVSGVVSALQTIFPIVSTVGRAFLTMPFQFVVNGLKTIAAVVMAPIRFLEFLAKSAIAVARELRLLQLGMEVLSIPFKVMQGLISVLGNAFNSFVTIIQKVLGFFDRFGGSTTKAKNELTNFGTASEGAKNKATGLSTTLDTLDDKAAPVGSAFRQMGNDIRGSIDDSSTAKFVQFSSSLQAITTIGSAVTNTLRNMAQSFKTFFAAGYDAAASMEDVTRSLNVLTAGDLMRQQTDGALSLEQAVRDTAGATQELLNRYQQFAFVSPFSREQLTSAHQLAQSLGFSAAEAENLVRLTADWATANGLSGEAIKSIILPLGQMNSLTKANTVDMKQLITAGNVPAFELLRQELERVTGTQVKMTEVQGLLSAGMVDSKTAINAVIAGFKQFEGQAENSLGTLSGLKNSFVDAKDNIIRGFVTPLLSADKGLRNVFTGVLNPQAIMAMTNAATRLGEVFAANVVGAVKSVASAFGVLNAIWIAIPGPIKETIGFALKFAATTAALTVGLIALGAILSTITSGLILFASPFSLAAVAVGAFTTTVITNFSTVRTAVADLLYSFGEIGEISRTVGKALQQVFNTGSFDPKVFDGLSNLSKSLASGLTSGLSTVGSALSSTFSLIVNWVAQFGDIAVKMYGFGVDTILAFADGIMAGVGAIYNAFQNIASIFTEWFQPNSPPKVAPDIDMHGFETIGVWVAGLIKGAQSYLPDLSGVIRPLLEKALDIFGAIGLFSFNVVIASVVAFGNVLSGVFQIMVGVGGAIVSEIALALSTAVNIISTLIDPALSFKDKFIGVLNEVGTFITGTFTNFGFLLTQTVSGSLTILQSLIDFFGGVFISALYSLNYAFPQTFEGMYQSVTTFVTQTMQSIDDFVTTTVVSFADLLSSMADYGSNIVNQFAEGIYSTIDVVASALQALGDMITYWLAPGSPPKLLPDIDDWGTAAAQEFLGGFSDADISVINDFGDTITKTLEKLNVDNINVEEVTRAFATGMDNLNKGGEFGSDVMERIVELTGTAGPEVASLTSKFKTLAEEQVKLNRTTAAYNTELKAAQGVLDGLNANEEIAANQKKIDALTNALSNTYLTTEERTRIQTQIDKLQATNKVKQLETQKKAQEENVSAVKDSIDTQKKLLDLSDAFDGTKQANAINQAGGAAEKQAKKTIDKMTDLMLKQKLAGKTTEEQIAIYKEYLSTLEEGSAEYVKTQTKIIELEARLNKERETSVKKLGKEGILAGKFGEAIAGNASALDGVASNFKAKTKEITDTVSGMVMKVKALWMNFTASFTLGKTTEIAIPMNFDSLPATIATVGRTLGTLAKYIDIAAKAFDTYVLKNQYVINAIISLATVLAGVFLASRFQTIALALTAFLTPMNLVVGGLILLGSAIATFIVQSGGLQGAFKRITDSFAGVSKAFSGGMTSGEATFDFTSFEGIATSVSSILGSVVGNVNKAFSSFYTSLSESWQTAINALRTNITTGWTRFTSLFDNINFDFSGLSRIKDFFSKNWLEVMGGVADTIIGITLGRWLLIIKGIALILKNFTLPTDILTEVAVNFVNSVDNYIIKPVLAALSSNNTFLGKLAGALMVFYSGVLTVLSTSIEGAFRRFGSGAFVKKLNEFFDQSAIGKALESNVNEAVAVILPSLGKNFDLSSFITLVITQFQKFTAAIGNVFETIKNTLGSGIIGNFLAANANAFQDFFTTISSPAFINALMTIGKTIGIVVGAVAGLTAVLIDVALIAVLKNLADIFIVVGQGLDRMYAGFQLILSGNILAGVGELFGGILDIVNGVFDTIGQTVADVILTMVEFFSPTWAAKLDPVVSAIAKIVAGFIGWQGVMTRVFGFFGGLISRFTGFFTQTNVTVGSTTKALTGFQRILEPIRGIVTNVGNSFKAGWTSLKAFGDTVPVLKEAVAALGKVFQVLLSPFQFMIQGLKNLFSGFFSTGSSVSIFTKLMETLRPAITFVSELFTGLVNVAKSVWAVITSLTTPLTAIVKAFINGGAAVLRFVDSILGFIVNSSMLRGTFTWMSELLSAVGGLLSVVGRVVIMIGQRFFNLGVNVLAALKPLKTLKLVFASVGAFASVIGASIASVASKIASFGIVVYDAISNGIQNLLSIDYVQQFIAWASGWVDAIWTGLSTFVTSIPTKIVEWTNALAEWLEPHSPPKFLPDLVEWGSKIALVFLQAIIDGPVSMLADWGMRIGSAIVNFDWLQFAGDLGQALSGLVSASIDKVVKFGVTVSDFIFVNPGKETKLAEQIYLALPNLDKIFGEDSSKKIAISVADLITINPDELTTASAKFDKFKQSLDGFFNIKAIPQAYINSLTAVKDFFSGDATLPQTVRTLFDELNKVVNLKAIPDLFVKGMDSLISLFNEDANTETVAKATVEQLERFALLIGVPQTALTSLGQIFDFVRSDNFDITSIDAAYNTLSKFETLTGIPTAVINSVQGLLDYFRDDTTVLGQTVNTIADAIGKFDIMTGIPSSVADGYRAFFDLFTGEATLPDTIRSISDSIGQIVAKLGIAIVSPFANWDFSTPEASLKTIKSILDGIYDGFTSLSEINFADIGNVFKPLTDLFATIQQQIDNITAGLSFIPGINLTGADVEGVDNVTDDVALTLSDAANNKTIDLPTRIKTITDSTNLSEESANVLTAFNDSLTTNAGVFDDNLTETINSYIAAGFNAEQIKKLAEEAGVQVPAGIEEAFGNPEYWNGANTEAGTQLTNLFTSIKDNLGIQSPSTEARDQIGIPIVQGIAEGLQTTEGIDFVTPITSLFQTILTTAQLKLTEIATKINIVAALFILDEAIVATTTTSIAEMVRIFEDGFKTIDELLRTSMEDWTELFEEFFSTLLDMADEFVTAFVDVFNELSRQVSDKIRSLIGTLKSFKSEFEAAGQSLAKAFIDGFKEYLGDDGAGRSAIEAAVNALGKFISSSNKTLEAAFFASGETFGKPFVDGIAKGLEGQKTNARLLAAVVAIVNRIITEARNAAGIASPSKVAALQVGIPIAQGIGVGLEAGVKFVSDGLDTLINGIGLNNNSIGSGFTSGVAKGITDTTNTVYDAIRDMATGGVDAARQALDIHSPSRVTRNLIGMPFVQGIANALVAGKGMLTPLTSDLLSVLPTDANFKFDIEAMRLKEQSIDVRYNGLMNSLPELTQDINLNRQAMYNVKAMSLQHEISRYVTNKSSQSFIQGMQQAYVNVSPHIAVMNEMQQARLSQQATGIVMPHQANKQQVLANTSNMHDNRSTVVNNHNEYHMHLTTSESRAARRVQRNFNSMRYGYRFR